ncbi:MAG: chromate efflux transporter, partial [Minicystis sp.]
MAEPATPVPQAEAPRAQALRELAAVFLRLGLTAFGGPAAHVAMMDEEIVRRRGWMTREDFLDHYGAANLIPGPTSTELVIHIGYYRGGLAGLVVAGACFILPAALLTGAIAWAYTRYGALPEATGLLYGVKPVIIAVLIQALFALARTALKTRLLVALAFAGTIASLLGVNVLAILLGAGALTAHTRWIAARNERGAGPPAAAFVLPFLGGSSAAVPFGLWPLFLFFLKIGAVLFGSGYVLLAFLRADLVERLHWLSEAQLLDAIAV